MSKNKKITVSQNISFREAIKKMDIEKLDLLVVEKDNKKVIGVFTMGDFRRAVFYGLDIDDKISLFINKEFEYLIEGYSKNEAKKKFLNNDLIFDIPILNKKFQLLKIIKRSDFFSSKEINNKKLNLNNIPVIIMAGGKGTRLDPFTRILPKPLIPIGNNPIIKVIMDLFMKCGVKKFYISVNEKSSMIKAYFHDLKSSYNIKYIEEKKPLGTAGSLKLLKNTLKSTFFVTNSDILIQTDYPSIIKFHKANNYDLTLVSSIRTNTIPYGVCSFDKSGELINIKEKPKYDFHVNTGLYIIEPKVLKLIPDNRKFDMNELIKKIRHSDMKVGVFPVSENSWKDIGQWSEYKKNIDKL